MNQDNTLHQTSRFIAIGLIVIGRNEGRRLKRALNLLPVGLMKILYVDSGSTDGSVELARSMGIHVHELDPIRPFSASRARREGVEVLLNKHPEIEQIQFLDGDSFLEPGWIEKAIKYLDANRDVGIVCGLLTEEAPEQSIYNRYSSLRWTAASTGDVESSGGIFMIRRSVYQTVGGFNAALLTGEESELCSRVREKGYRIVRLNEKMARHDADIVSFYDWWTRAVWGGYGDALEYVVLKGEVTVQRRRETRSVSVWAIFMPVMFFLGLLGLFRSIWFIVLPFICVLGYTMVTMRIMLNRLRQGDSIREAGLYAILCLVRKLPYAIGFYSYRIGLGKYFKRPDPHDVRAL